jgi:GrpB-like predicted nucleotidyltransferase (UPF0157 family)
VPAPWLLGAIEHVGSTAVAGLAAKPVIDLMAQVTDVDVAVKQAAGTLGELGSVHSLAPNEPWLLDQHLYQRIGPDELMTTYLAEAAGFRPGRYPDDSWLR